MPGQGCQKHSPAPDLALSSPTHSVSEVIELFCAKAKWGSGSFKTVLLAGTTDGLQLAKMEASFCHRGLASLGSVRASESTQASERLKW